MFTTEAAVTLTQDFEIGPTAGAGITFNWAILNITGMVRETYINNDPITDIGLDIAFIFPIDGSCIEFMNNL